MISFWSTILFLSVLMILFLCLPFSYLLLNTFDIFIFLSSLSTDFLIPFMAFLWQGYWSGLPFLLPADHVLQEKEAAEDEMVG